MLFDLITQTNIRHFMFYYHLTFDFKCVGQQCQSSLTSSLPFHFLFLSSVLPFCFWTNLRCTPWNFRRLDVRQLATPHCFALPFPFVLQIQKKRFCKEEKAHKKWVSSPTPAVTVKPFSLHVLLCKKKLIWYVKYYSRILSI